MNRNIKNFALVLITLITHLSLSAQGWERIYPGDPNSPQGYPVGLGLEVFPEANGYFVYSEFDGEKRFFRTDQDGFQTSSTTVANYGDLVIKNSDGDFVFIRRLGSPNPPEEDLALVKTDPNGNQIWEHRFGDPASNEAVTALLQSSDGNYVFAGAGYNAVTGYYPHIYKTNENGDVLWKTTYSFDYDIFDYSLTETADGGYLLAGSDSYDFSGNINTVLLKLASDGTLQWVNEIPNTLKIETILADGNEYLLWGNDLTGIALSKTDDNGNIIWTQQYGSGSGVDLLKTADGGYALLSNTGDGDIRLTKTDIDGNAQWEELYGGSLIDYARDFKATADGGYIITGAANAEGEEVSLYLIKTDAQGLANTNLIEGYVLYDVDGDCADDPTEMPLEDWIVTATGDGATFYGTVNDNGYYRIEVGMGSWDVSVAVPNDYWMPCVDSETVTFGMNFDTTQVNFAVKSVAQCPLMEVNMQAGGLRICDENLIYVNCRNQGTWIAEDASVEITFDDSLSVVDASVPFSVVSGNTYSFELGDIDFLDQVNFYVKVMTGCDEELLGQSLCMDAIAYPDTTCLPENPLWSGASIEVSAWCEGSEVKLQLKNVGDAAMSSSLEYLVVEDDVIMSHTPFGPLEPDDFIQLTKEADGTFYRIQSQQEPFHPGHSMPSAFIEGCGENENGEISLGFVNQYALDDANSNEDLLCLEVVGSFDPNAKAAFPRGYHEPNYIEANTELEYVIYFQNTGTAPAYKVVLEDQLSAHLNPATIRPGASSHDYDFELLGEGLVRFTFDNIMLPDSNTNEPESHGFVQFKIQQKADLLIGTEIYNDAAIFFDFNAPIITNKTLHTIAEDFITVGIGPVSRPDISVKVMPNPFERSAIFEVKGNPAEMMTFSLFDATGRLVRTEQFSGIMYRFERGDLPSGVFFYTITDEHGGVNSGKVVVQQIANYFIAVIEKNPARSVHEYGFSLFVLKVCILEALKVLSINRLNMIKKHLHFTAILLLALAFAQCTTDTPTTEAESKNPAAEAKFVSNPQEVPEQEVKTLMIGNKAPDFRLPGVDGQFHTLADYAEAKALVIIFTCNHCPTAQAYEERIKAIASDYSGKGAQVVAISPNSPLGLLYEELGYSDLGDSYEDMVIRAREADYNFPYLYDGDDQKVALAYGPVATPHCFVFDENRTLRYLGRIDASEKPGTANGEDLRNAIDKVLAGEKIEQPVTKTFGCSTKWGWKTKLRDKVDGEWATKKVNLQEAKMADIKNLIKNDGEKLRLINVWATWCGPCRLEYPEFVVIQRMFGARDFEFISISADKLEKKDAALRFLEEVQSGLTNYIAETDDKYALIEAIDPSWNGALPYTMLIEPGGQVVWSYQGEVDFQKLKRTIVEHPMIGRVY